MFKGSATALVTPFKDGEVDYQAFKNLVDHQILNKTDALVVLGTTGETPTLTEDEKNQLVDCSIEVNQGRVPIIVGTGSNNTKAAIQATEKFSERAIDGVLVQTPYYNKTNKEGLYQHFKQIADHSKVPVILYNVPSRTGMTIPVSLVERLADIKNIRGLKDATGDLAYGLQVIANTPDDFYLYSGEDHLTTSLMAVGAQGVISVASNVAPKYIHDMTQACLGNDFKTAGQMQVKLTSLVKALFNETNPIPVKKALSLLNLAGGGELRLPLTESSSGTDHLLEKALKELSLYDQNN